jgi:hypothetical protein
MERDAEMRGTLARVGAREYSLLGICNSRMVRSTVFTERSSRAAPAMASGSPSCCHIAAATSTAEGAIGDPGIDDPLRHHGEPLLFDEQRARIA